MAAGYSDLFLNQGETFNTELTLNDPNGLPYNLTGFNIYSQAVSYTHLTLPTKA